MKTDLKIYIDLDGVLVNWLESACEYFNVEYPGKDPEEKVKKVSNTFLTEEYNILKSSIDTLADNYDWWFNLKKYSWSDYLLRFCKQKGETFILTKPMSHGNCYKAKYDWCLANLDIEPNKIIITEVPKSHFVSHKGSEILIDDRVSNITEWNQSGGSAFHWDEMIDYKKPYDLLVTERINQINTLIRIKSDLSYYQSFTKQIQK